MVTHTRNWSSAFNSSKCTHTAVSSEHTHCEHAPGAVGSHCSSARGAIGGSVPCSRVPQSWYWRWRECCSFTIPTFNPCRTWDLNPQPLDYKSDSLTIRPRLPHQMGRWVFPTARDFRWVWKLSGLCEVFGKAWERLRCSADGKTRFSELPHTSPIWFLENGEWARGVLGLYPPWVPPVPERWFPPHACCRSWASAVELWI